MTIADIRKEYRHGSLSESDIASDPIIQFSNWFNEALNAQIPEANAMSVATVSADGRPSSRILLIKEFDQRGFVWFTNYESRKGHDLDVNPYAALLFYWIELERQVRIEGRVEKTRPEESDTYFHSRPLNSRLGAHASKQSQPVSNRHVLEERLSQVQQQYAENPPRPDYWGGYRLVPDLIEFWQGRPSRLHDRIVYRRQQDRSWIYQRLQP